MSPEPCLGSCLNLCTALNCIAIAQCYREIRYTAGVYPAVGASSHCLFSSWTLPLFHQAQMNGCNATTPAMQNLGPGMTVTPVLHSRKTNVRLGEPPRTHATSQKDSMGDPPLIWSSSNGLCLRLK